MLKKHLNYLLFSFLLIGFSSCQDAEVEPDINSKDELSHDEEIIDLKLNSDADNLLRNQESLIQNGVIEEVNQDVIQRAIDPDQYECDIDNSDLTNYFNSIIPSISLFEFLYLDGFSNTLLEYTIISKSHDRKEQVYGIDGEFTNDINRTFKDLKRFWDIPSDKIELAAFKSTDIYRDDYKEHLMLVGATEEEAQQIIDLYDSLYNKDKFWDLTHPLFSFNAFAFRGATINLPDGQQLVLNPFIGMGDGILESYDAIGLGDVAPQAILAHEYAHQIQYANGYFPTVTDPANQPEATRYTELMADAYAAYYLTHKRGATMNKKRVRQFLKVFYNIGDCQFDSGSHHGTLKQRMAAAEFGFQVADDALPKGKILSSDAFYDLFNQALPDILDA